MVAKILAKLKKIINVNFILVFLEGGHQHSTLIWMAKNSKTLTWLKLGLSRHLPSMHLLPTCCWQDGLMISYTYMLMELGSWQVWWGREHKHVLKKKKRKKRRLSLTWLQKMTYPLLFNSYLWMKWWFTQESWQLASHMNWTLQQWASPQLSLEIEMKTFGGQGSSKVNASDAEDPHMMRDCRATLHSTANREMSKGERGHWLPSQFSRGRLQATANNRDGGEGKETGAFINTKCTTTHNGDLE